MDRGIERTLRYKGQQVSLMDEDTEEGYRQRSFEDHFRPEARSDYSDLIQKERIIPKEEEAKPKKGKNIVELLTGGEDIGEFARKLNLDPEMAEKMLVPLLALLDKYGVGETLTASPKVESAANAFEIIRDVAPIVKGAAEFISGRRAELESTDLAFLEQIREAQGVADASLFDDDEDELFTVGESVIEEPVVETPSASEPEPLDLNSFNSKDWGNFFATEGSMVATEKKYDIVNNDLTAALDAQQNAVEQWAKQEGMAIREQVNNSKGLDMDVRTDYQNMEIGGADAGVAHTFTEVQGMNKDAFAIVDVSELAAHQGLSMNEIMEGDSQRKINRESQEEWETEPIDVSEFVPADEPIVDYADLEVPEAAEEYDPLHIQDFDIPNFDIYEIEEVENLQEEENKSRNDDTED